MRKKPLNLMQLLDVIRSLTLDYMCRLSREIHTIDPGERAILQNRLSELSNRDSEIVKHLSKEMELEALINKQLESYDNKRPAHLTYCEIYKGIWESRTSMPCTIYDCPFDGWTTQDFIDALETIESVVDEDIAIAKLREFNDS